MASLFLNPIVEILLESLKSAATAEIKLLWGVEDEVEHLLASLTGIDALLKDAEDKQWNSLAIKNWLRMLEDVAYDADDVIDEFETQAQLATLKKVQPSTVAVSMKKKVCNAFCFIPRKVVYRHEIGSKLQGIRGRLDKIASERENLGLTISAARETYNPLSERILIGSHVNESDVIGREDDEKIVINMLTSNVADSHNFAVIPIVGMGGLGKTTLAQVVYNRLSDHFHEMRAWVSVPDPFEIDSIMKAITESVTKKKCDLSSKEALENEFLGVLRGKKFLLVLDDVWNEELLGWDRLHNLLGAGGKGSKVLVTTRSEIVANNIGTVPAHKLPVLSDSDSWGLFEREAFKEVNETQSLSPFVRVGKQIVRKCNGLPLALKFLGRLLRSNRSVMEWNKILNSEIWDLPESRKSVLPALQLSYLNLPPELKICFAYCSIFPKGHVFSKDELVRLWMAQKYIRDQGEEKMEKIGGKYFDDLWMRSFFQHIGAKFLDGDSDFTYKVKYRMHDLIHDLAKFVTNEECYSVVEEKLLNIGPKARHVFYAYSEKGVGTFNEKFYDCKRLHSLFLSSKVVTESSLSQILHTFKLLRVLSLAYCRVTELPESIGDLLHLRYLDLSFNIKLTKLPDSVCALCNLQTLKIDSCYRLYNLPQDMSQLVGLRHLHCDIPGLKHMPPRIGKLAQLQSLSKFIVGKEDGFKIAEMKGLDHLGGSIEISGLDKVMGRDEAGEAMLKNKQQLKKLTMNWDEDDPYSPREIRLDEEVIEGLEPHRYLQELCIKNYKGANLPSWLCSLQLFYLQSIELNGWKYCQRVPPLGLLPMLKDLKISAFDGLQHLSNEFSGHNRQVGVNRNTAFPCLESLHLIRLPILEDWFELEKGDLPCLTELRLADCPKLKTIPSQLLPSLVNLDITGCESLEADLRFPQLEKLVLSASNGMLLESVPNLTSLSSLTCCDYPNISAKLLEPLVSLKELRIDGCHDVEAVEVGLPLGLQELELENCYELQSLLDAHLPLTLKTLRIRNCKKLALLPADLNRLSLLESLNLSSCPRLKSLPEHGLPSSLLSICIYNCPLLYERCIEGVGKDWPKIANIPFKYLRKQ